MADSLLSYGQANYFDLEEEDEGDDWGEIFNAPENHWRNFGDRGNSGISVRDDVDREDISVTGEHVEHVKMIVENNECKPMDSSKSLTRMELNDHKAGMVGLDKEKINQIILEASKGSRFYENELKKEKQVSERITKQTACLKKITAQQRQEALQTVDLIVKELDDTRDLTRTFVHIDMDAFYAAVEILDNPELRDKPMAVGSNAMLSTSNYPARRYGVRAAMPGFIAKKLCPELVIVPPHFEKYKEYSHQVQEVLAEYDPNFAMASLDEAYLDLTEYLENRQKNKEKTTFTKTKSGLHSKLKSEEDLVEENAVDEIVEFGSSAEEIVKELRFRIEQKTRLTASAGIAPNVMLAKVCSDRNKPNGQFFLKPDRNVILDFVHKLPIRKISGIGRVSEQMLKALQIETCKDLYTSRDLIYLLHSPISFRFLIQVSLGLGRNFIMTDSKRKSIGTETTFPEISKPDEVLDTCDKLCQSLAEDVKKENLKGKTVTIKLKTVNFEVKSRSLSPINPVSTYEEISRAAKELLKNEMAACFPDPLRLRLMGVRLSNFQNVTSVSSREGKQNTITGFLKPKKTMSFTDAPSSYTINQTLIEEEVAIEHAGQDVLTEHNMMTQSLASQATYQLADSSGDYSQPGKSSSDGLLFEAASSPVSSYAEDCKGNSSNDTWLHPSPLSCPVCGQEQVIKLGQNAMTELNKHIDLCLNKAAIREIVSQNNSSSATESVMPSAYKGKGVETGTQRGKRKRKHSDTASKKATLHSFWKKD